MTTWTVKILKSFTELFFLSSDRYSGQIITISYFKLNTTLLARMDENTSMLQFFDTFKWKKSIISTLFTFKSNITIKNGDLGQKWQILGKTAHIQCSVGRLFFLGFMWTGVKFARFPVRFIISWNSYKFELHGCNFLIMELYL